MTLDQLRVFVAVARREHVTRAAEALHMTPSAVSAAIATLEARHGVALFDRVGRAIVLNPNGRAFLAHAEAVLGEVRTAETALTDLGDLRRGDLTIMASQTVGSYWLPPRLLRYHETYPGMRLHVAIGNTEAVAHAVEEGRVELGLVEGSVDHAALVPRVVATDDMVVVVAPEHPWATRRSVARRAFTQTPWLLRERGSGTREAFERAMHDAGIAIDALDVPLVLPGNEAILSAVAAGRGATLASRHVASPWLRAGLLREVATPPVTRPFSLLRHAERYRSKAADAFEAMITASNAPATIRTNLRR